MNRPSSLLVAALAAASFTAAAPSGVAADWLVDATGAGGAFTDVTQAMAVATPGDRILVVPGVYPKFDFVVGVSVIGLGADPSEVVIRRIYVHVNDPKVGYDALLQNVTLKSDDPADTLLLHGNEQGPGSLTIDGVRIDGGGVYLRGGQEGFYVHLSDSVITPQPGYGLSGEACYVGGPGNFVDLRNTRIVGWDALPQYALPAGIALRLAGGTHARIANSEILAGHGAASSNLTVAAGADAIAYGLSGDSGLLLEGGTVVRGGDGVIAPGGDGVAIEGEIFLGNANVSGGAGTPPGAAFGLDQPTVIGIDLHLALEPDLKFAEGATSVKSGDDVSIQLNPSQVSMIVLGFGVDVPASSLFFPLAPAQGLIFVPAAEVSGQVPTLDDPVTGLMLFVQGVVVDPGTKKLGLTNAATIRLDLL